MEQKITSTTTKGIVISLVLIVFTLVTYFANIKANGPLQWVGYAFFIGGIIWSVNYFGKQSKYNCTFGNYFAHGFKVSAVVTVIMIIYLVLFIFLFPDFKENAISEARKSMLEKNNLTSDQIDQAIQMTRKFFMVFLIGGTLVAYLFFAAIAALIGAAVTKKEPNQLPQQDNQLPQ